MATHSSILAWRTPWTEEPGRLQSTGYQKSWICLKQLSTARMDWSKDLNFLKYYTLSQHYVLNNLSSINVKSLEHVGICKHVEYIHYPLLYTLIFIYT